MGLHNIYPPFGNMGRVRFIGNRFAGIKKEKSFKTQNSISVIMMMRESTKDVGQEGEDIAFSYIRQQGYRVVDRNYRCPYGEVDLIAKDGETFVFIEVKSRQSTLFGQPEEAVDFKKRKKLSTVALWYLEEKKINDYRARFDVISILLSKQPPEIKLFRDAFDFI